MGRTILLFISVILVTFFIINAFWLQLNGYRTIDLIDRYPILFSPANFVYYIWFFIFIILFIWIINYFRLYKSGISSISKLKTILFLLIAILQILSIWCWNSEQPILTIGFLFLQVISLFLLYLTYPLKTQQLKIRMPIAIYFSWTTYLFLLSICYYIVDIGWQGLGLSRPLWAVIIMTFGTAIALHFRYHYYDIAYPIIFIWCYIGIAVSNGMDQLLVTTAALFLIVVMITAIIFMKKNPVHLK